MRNIRTFESFPATIKTNRPLSHSAIAQRSETIRSIGAEPNWPLASPDEAPPHRSDPLHVQTVGPSLAPTRSLLNSIIRHVPNCSRPSNFGLFVIIVHSQSVLVRRLETSFGQPSIVGQSVQSGSGRRLGERKRAINLNGPLASWKFSPIAVLANRSIEIMNSGPG